MQPKRWTNHHWPLPSIELFNNTLTWTAVVRYIADKLDSTNL
jgi:hypothetical protein